MAALPPSSCTHARTASEAELASLALDMNALSCTANSAPSRLSDDDLLDLLPPLGQSCVEEAEEQFRMVAQQALAFAATPSPSLSPSPFAGGSARTSPVRSRRATPDYADSSYFALSRRNLYDSGESSWSSAASSLYSASSTPSLCDSAASSYTADSLTSTPEHSPFPSSCARFPSAPTTAPPSPTLSYSNPFAAELRPSLSVDTSSKPGIASRRPKASPDALKLSLPPLAAPPFPSHTLRGSRSFSYPAGASSSDNLSPPSHSMAKTRKPRWMREFEDIAGVSSLAAAAAVEQVNLSRSRERRRERSASGEGSPILLKPRRGSEWAF
ncbi:hypothetical protein JCM8097_003615 [Rhodosporidiobolus ruineniae]